MKKLLTLVIAMLLAFSVFACAPAEEAPAAEEPATEAPAAEAPAEEAPAEEPMEEAPAEGMYELALITDIGTIDDKSFNQGTWEGLEQFAQESGKAAQYYQPTEQSDEAYLSSIELAVNAGAKVIVTPGFLFEVPIFVAQDMYPDINFILIDGWPHNVDYSEFRTNDNTVGIIFAEEQVGYLAGYAAVKDGNTLLGFQGGMAVPAVVRYGYGFVAGADAAAAEMGVDITIDYNYSGDFAATPENQARAAGWYGNGTEVIFACGGAVGNSVMAAAEAGGEGKQVIGVDVDQGHLSETVVNSALKGLGTATYTAVKALYDGEFPGGQNLTMDASNNGVSLAMESSRFETFDQAAYDALYAQIASGAVDVPRDDDYPDAAGDPTVFPVTNTTVNYHQ